MRRDLGGGLAGERMKAAQDAHGERADRDDLADLDRADIRFGDPRGGQNMAGAGGSNDERLGASGDGGNVEQVVIVRVADEDEVRARRGVRVDRGEVGDERRLEVVAHVAPRDIGIDEEGVAAGVEAPARDPEVGQDRADRGMRGGRAARGEAGGQSGADEGGEVVVHGGRNPGRSDGFSHTGAP